MTRTDLSASVVADTLMELGATHVLGIPDNGSAALFDLVQKREGVELLTVTREGEAFAIATGLWIGGSSPVVLVQNTGLLESGDSLRGTAVRAGVPLLCLVGYRGFARMVRAGIDPFASTPPARVLRRSDVDSAALLTEPTMRAWGVPYGILEPGSERAQIERAWNHAQSEEHPTVLLMISPLR